MHHSQLLCSAIESPRMDTADEKERLTGDEPPLSPTNSRKAVGVYTLVALIYFCVAGGAARVRQRAA